ncbi:hypothetical protein ACSQ67_010771 [Phaseolus vulgaris]
MEANTTYEKQCVRKSPSRSCARVGRPNRRRPTPRRPRKLCFSARRWRRPIAGLVGGEGGRCRAAGEGGGRSRGLKTMEDTMVLINQSFDLAVR